MALQVAAAEGNVLALEAEMDRTLLRLFQQALKADKYVPSGHASAAEP